MKIICHQQKYPKNKGERKFSKQKENDKTKNHGTTLEEKNVSKSMGKYNRLSFFS